MIPATVRRLGGIAGAVAAGVAVGVVLYLNAPGADRRADAAGPAAWLLLGGGCVLPVAMFYGWLAGAWVAGRLVRPKSR